MGNSVAGTCRQENKPKLPLTACTGTFTNELYGTVTIKPTATGLTMALEHHPGLVAQLDNMVGQTFCISYANRAFGVFPLTFILGNGKPTSFDLKASDFEKFDPYRFVKK